MPNNGMMSLFGRPDKTPAINEEEDVTFKPFQRYRGTDEVRKQARGMIPGTPQPVKPIGAPMAGIPPTNTIRPTVVNPPAPQPTQNVTPGAPTLAPVPGVPIPQPVPVVPPPAVQPPSNMIVQPPQQNITPGINTGINPGNLTPGRIDQQNGLPAYRRPVDYSLTRMNREIM
ncbi:MAG: hypothetical protein WC455_19980 [Dehalococcoidia bacterium]|jgi:hypothetical protein